MQNQLTGRSTAGFLRSFAFQQYSPSLIALLASCGLGILLGAMTLISPLFSVAFLVVLVAGYYLILHPFHLTYILLVAIVFTSAIPRNQLTPILKVNELVLILAVGWLFVPRQEQQLRSVFLPGTPFAAAAILAMGTAIVPLFSYLIRGFSLSTSELLGLLAPLQYMCLFYFFAMFPRTEAQRHRIIQVMWLLASLVALIGLLQAARIGPVAAFLSRFYPSEHTDEAVQLGRLTSVFGAWNVLGTFLMSVLVLALALQDYPRSPLFRLNTRLMVLLAIPCLFATNAYASLIGLAMGFVILNLMQPRDIRRFFLLFLFIVGAVIILWPIISIRLAYQFDTDSLMLRTLRYRLLVWQKYYIPLIQRDPLWGVSPNLDNVTFAYAESQYLYMAFHAGIVAVMSHLIWVGLCLGWLFSVMQKGPKLSQNLAAAAFTLLIVYSVMGITNPVFTYSGAIDFFWIVLGLIVNERLLE